MRDNAPEISDVADGVFDAIAFLGARLVIDHLTLAVAAAQDDGNPAVLTQVPSDDLCVVALVGDQVACPFNPVQKQISRLHQVCPEAPPGPAIEPVVDRC